MGPFKHTVDDGLDLRKAGYECMYTLLDSCLDRLDIYTFLNHVEEGLKDDYDIKMLTYLMLVRLATLVPNAVLQSECGVWASGGRGRRGSSGFDVSQIFCEVMYLM